MSKTEVKEEPSPSKGKGKHTAYELAEALIEKDNEDRTPMSFEVSFIQGLLDGGSSLQDMRKEWTQLHRPSHPKPDNDPDDPDNGPGGGGPSGSNRPSAGRSASAGIINADTRRKAMVPKPDPYDGSFDGFDIWWRSCRSYIADANITDEIDKIRVVLTSMKKGSAGTWATNWERENERAYYDGIGYISWRDFEIDIKREFRDPNEQQKATDKLGQRLDLRGRTIEAAFVEYEHLASLAGMPTSLSAFDGFHISNLRKVLPTRLITAMVNIGKRHTTYKDFKIAACDYLA